MVLPIGDRRPFSMPVVKHGTVGTSVVSGTMITRAPWPAPTSKYYVLRKVVATQFGTNLSGGYLSIWDQDVSNATPVARGSAGGPLLVLPLTVQSGAPFFGTVNSMNVLDIDACPQEYFQAGVTVQPNVSGNVLVSVELDVI